MISRKKNVIKEYEDCLTLMDYMGVEVVCVIDREDYELLGGYYVSKDGKGYSIISANTKTGKLGAARVHRLIIDVADGEVCDHINRDKTDNRKENLRSVPPSVNSCNAKKPTHGKTSKFKGVHYSESRRKFISQHKGKTLGYFYTEEAAAEAYAKAGGIQ